MAKQYILPPISFPERKDYASRVRAWNEAHTAETGSMRKCFVLTFGCQQNEADSEKIAGMAEEIGYAKRENSGLKRPIITSSS